MDDRFEEKEKSLLNAFFGTFRHFFGEFSPSVQAR